VQNRAKSHGRAPSAPGNRRKAINRVENARGASARPWPPTPLTEAVLGPPRRNASSLRRMHLEVDAGLPAAASNRIGASTSPVGTPGTGTAVRRKGRHPADGGIARGRPAGAEGATRRPTAAVDSGVGRNLPMARRSADPRRDYFYSPRGRLGGRVHPPALFFLCEVAADMGADATKPRRTLPTSSITRGTSTAGARPPPAFRPAPGVPNFTRPAPRPTRPGPWPTIPATPCTYCDAPQIEGKGDALGPLRPSSRGLLVDISQTFPGRTRRKMASPGPTPAAARTWRGLAHHGNHAETYVQGEPRRRNAPTAAGRAGPFAPTPRATRPTPRATGLPQDTCWRGQVAWVLAFVLELEELES